MNIRNLKRGFAGFTLTFTLGLFLFTIIYDGFNSKSTEFKRWVPLLKQANVTLNHCDDSMTTMRKQEVPEIIPEDVVFCKGCNSELRKKGRGAELAIVTKGNTPLTSKIVDPEKKEMTVSPSLFSTFPKEPPFTNQKFDSCSIVGNGGILNNSFCGKQIDSAQFVFRCNIPPLTNGFEMHVGNRTDFVTANPSILVQKFHSLQKDTHRFVKHMEYYGNSWVLLPSFNHISQVEVCLRAIDILNYTRSPLRPIFLNPVYVKNLQGIWRAHHLKERRLSTGFIIVNLALELCNSVDLYGFWPFGIHPHNFKPLKNHYYDERKANKRYHAMSSEFENLLKLHKKGVLRIHLGDCQPQQSKPEC
ncbi:alpha-2,8-sialyltransferase 8E-like isoform X2 [Gouania willdenowi]|uniref:alpha-2,8-sialyltransferase 8E-like isoform X2 n=1 Tax=Gouania willdenowi TaxID=441366 RepID=UPI001056E00A|nr:alpha-2,8-sialyltransferase 8E-like isoform X2 [Gouania willdenowi]